MALPDEARGASVPAAAFCRVKAWNCGELMLPFPSAKDESSLRISMLSFRLDGVIPPFPVFVLVFLLGILVGNFIFNFLLFSCGPKINSFIGKRQKREIQGPQKQNKTTQTSPADHLWSDEMRQLQLNNIYNSACDWINLKICYGSRDSRIYLFILSLVPSLNQLGYMLNASTVSPKDLLISSRCYHLPHSGSGKRLE